MTAPLTLVPLTGPWHLRHPRWNVVTVRDALEALDPDVVVTSALAPGYDADAGWQGTDEIALPWTLVGWARRRGTPVLGVGAPPPVPDAEADLRRYLEGFPAARAELDAARRTLAPLETLLPLPLDLTRLLGEVVPPLVDDLRQRLDAFGDGPATSWRFERARLARDRTLIAGGQRPAWLVALDLWPAVVAALEEAGVAWSPIASPPVSVEARRRALLDVAWRADTPDPAGLLRQLREGQEAEAGFLEAQVLLTHGHPAEALEVLERVSHGDFREPYLLPGLLLARLGQLRDLADRRDRALQAYRGVLALAWAPAEAREAALAGLERPFEVPSGPT